MNYVTGLLWQIAETDRRINDLEREAAAHNTPRSTLRGIEHLLRIREKLQAQLPGRAG